MIPLLYTSYNRLEFTKKTLPRLFKNTFGDVLFVIIDAGSTDGTVEYLKNNIKKVSNNKKFKLFLKNDMRISEVMDYFFNYIKECDFKYAAKIDNDTLVPENWLGIMIDAAEKNNVDVLQAKHYIMNNYVKDWKEWTAKMEQKQYKNHTLFFNDFVGGSGIVFDRKTTICFSHKEYSQQRLHGWTEFQATHSEWKKAFYDGVFIELLDMTNDNVLKDELYPDYYTFTKRKI